MILCRLQSPSESFFSASRQIWTSSRFGFDVSTKLWSQRLVPERETRSPVCSAKLQILWRNSFLRSCRNIDFQAPLNGNCDFHCNLQALRKNCSSLSLMSWFHFQQTVLQRR